ncbi:hypothetical protein BJ684DRAFT_21526 [Piptocephalis cylindrospora]|uniref:CCHC-type domain-containing protein n=1 Tax=Piptocephalis cylindrospora TaxID=1907219 RepID=A0A4P9Y237_9FUNG|nr:hypothetical protein BJ684DRAFT_21526 [Piptocephalis cylindrospora]|eukprot:RKP11900.1 hypothetical protein BJ684DRAFT_21526 [Piptocephalis cylindrospora]
MWLEEFTKASRLNHWNQNWNRHAEVIQAFLAGEPLLWFDSTTFAGWDVVPNAAPVANAHYFVPDFRARYITAEYVYQWVDKLDARQQHPNESAIQYIEDMQQLYKMADPARLTPELLRVRKIINGLQPSIRLLVSVASPQSMIALVTCVQNCENQQQLLKKDAVLASSMLSTATKVPSVENSARSQDSEDLRQMISETKDMMKELTQSISVLSMNHQAYQRNPYPVSHSYSNHQAPRMNYPLKNPSFGPSHPRQDTRTCFKCHQPGHLAWNCPYRCPICHEVGHEVSHCPRSQHPAPPPMPDPTFQRNPIPEHSANPATFQEPSATRPATGSNIEPLNGDRRL